MGAVISDFEHKHLAAKCEGRRIKLRAAALVLLMIAQFPEWMITPEILNVILGKHAPSACAT